MVPCKGCLVMTQCKERLYKSGAKSSVNGMIYNTYGITGMVTKEKCEPLAQYLYPNNKGRIIYSAKKERIRTAREFFNLPSEFIT